MEIMLDAGALCLLYACFYKKWKREGSDRWLLKTTMFIYLSFVLYYTLMPVLASLPDLFTHPYKPVNLEPFVDVRYHWGDYMRQIELNTLMTVPFGILFPLLLGGKGKWWKTLAACFLMSVAIELLQPLISLGRSADITDVITNTCGAGIGYVIYVVTRPVSNYILNNLAEGRFSC